MNEQTPKEKAVRLVTDMFYTQPASYCSCEQAKQCALLAVDEILKQDVFNYTSDWSNTI
jgi:hypothetical protein